VALDDYGSLMQTGMNLIPDVNQQILKQAQASSLGAEAQANQAHAAETAQKMSRLQQFQADIKTLDGSPTSVSHLIEKYPEYADEIKKGWDVQEEAKKQSDLTQLGEIYSAASGGNWALAKKLAHARADAEKANGLKDPAYDAALGVMDEAADGDHAQQKVVLNLLGTHIAAVTGPEHFGTVYGGLKGGYTLDAGATRYDENGNVVAQSPFIKGQDGAIYERDGANGTPTTPTAPAKPDTTPGGDDGFNTAVATVLKHEGGYNPHDINGAPVNFGINQGANPDVDVKSLTKDEAAQIYKEKYWGPSGAADLPASMQAPYFDTYIINPKRAQQFLKAAGNDPNRFMTMRENWMQSLAKQDPAKYGPVMKGWANRNADLRLTIAGGNAPPGYHLLVPGSNDPGQYRTHSRRSQSAGLDASQQYQLNTKTGALTGLGKIDAADQPLPGDETKSGPAYLATLPQNIATQVKALAEGRLPMPSSFALAKPYWQKMLQMTAQYDPTFDAATAPARKAAITAFTGNGRPRRSLARSIAWRTTLTCWRMSQSALPALTLELDRSTACLPPPDRRSSRRMPRLTIPR
jgi:hypothetical protein